MMIPRKPRTLIIAIVLSMLGVIRGSLADLSPEECNLSLDLSAVGLKSLPNGFLNSERVTNLTLDENDISSLSYGTFEFLPKLSYLSLAKNKFTTLDLSAFSMLRDLETLVLNQNCEAQITERYITEAPQYVDNYDDYLEVVETTTAVYKEYHYCNLTFNLNLDSLRHLFLERNDIKKLSYAFGSLPALTHLYLSHNPVEVNQDAMSSLSFVAPALTHLFLKNCDILHLDVSPLPTITSLYLDNNMIDSICSEHGCEYSSLKLNGTRHLETLSVSHNRITKIRMDSFIDTINLLHLDLSYNKISEIREGTFDNLKMLRSLSLQHNKLVQLGAEDTFKDLIKLESLFLGGNDISIISDGLFKNLRSLRQLMLNGTKITSIDAEIFSKLPSLEELSLADNQISRIPEGALPTPGLLIALDLDKNQFKSSDDISLTDEPRMLSLSLRDNPLKRITAQWIANIRAKNLTIILGPSPLL